MTGKESLEYIANLLFMFISTGRHSGKNYTLKALCKIADDLDELTKYKMAFEILKDKGICVRNDRLYFDYEIYIKSSKEERELLEELMKDENS